MRTKTLPTRSKTFPTRSKTFPLILSALVALSAAMTPPAIAGPATRIGSTLARPAMLPDLVVDRTWLRGCRVMMQVTNRSRGAIPDAQHRTANVKVYLYTFRSRVLEIRNYPLTRVDPTGALKRPGGSVTFNTGESLAESTYVDIRVDDRRVIDELSDTNNSLDPTPLVNPPLACLLSSRGLVSVK